MKKKRVLNGLFISGLALVILIALSIYKIPNFINTTRLEELGYSDEAIKAIYDKNIRKEILDNNYYSAYLNSEVTKDSFNTDYVFLYSVADELNGTSFALYERLIELKGYSKEELMKVYDKLPIYEITPLLVFDKIENIDNYINDCLSHTENTKDSIILSNDYLNAYTNEITIDNPDSIEVFISLKAPLGDYVPEKLVEIPSQLASPDLYLESRALEAFQNLCDAISREELGIYAVSAYRSYEDQETVYNSYSSDKEADQNTIRPGYLDNQSGLSVMVVSIENESLSGFKDTEAYIWLKDNAHKYGFIFRYPENKQSITGQEGMPYYLRYVGEDLAKKIYESGLTFDEYYMFYMYEIEKEQ